MISTSKKSGSSEAAWWGVLICSIALLAWLYFVGTGVGELFSSAENPTVAETEVDDPDSAIEQPEVVAEERVNPYPGIFKAILLHRTDPKAKETFLRDSPIMRTVAVVLAAQALSFVIGVVVGALQLSRIWVLRFIGAAYVEAIRGIPIYVMLLFVYFGVRGATGMQDILTPFTSAVIALGVCYGAYMAEVVRAGFLAIPVEEIEAASLEASSIKVLFYIILPQALRTILPALANECIALLKDSAIVGVITLVDITRAAQMHAGANFRYLEAFTALALLYLVLSLILSRIQRVLEFYYGDAKAHRH